jgi:hypothetical protein
VSRPYRTTELSQMAYARLAGVMYFFTAFDLTGVVIISGITGTGTFLATAHAIGASETVYRIGILLGLIGDLSTIILAIALYAILKPVDGILAMTALLFRLAESAIGGVVVVLGFAELQIYLDANHASALSANQLGVLADLMSRTSAAGTDVSVVCFSIGSAIFFYLFLRSGYIPRALALWGLLGSLLCTVAFSGSLLAPQSSDVLRGIGALPIGIAEPVVGLWLLIRGIRIAPQVARP